MGSLVARTTEICHAMNDDAKQDQRKNGVGSRELVRQLRECASGLYGLHEELETHELISRAADIIERLSASMAAEDWVQYAYARLGVMRDEMSPHEVAVVQRFLGPLPNNQIRDAAKPRSL